jgi:hypothetical protein
MVTGATFGGPVCVIRFRSTIVVPRPVTPTCACGRTHRDGWRLFAYRGEWRCWDCLPAAYRAKRRLFRRPRRPLTGREAALPTRPPSKGSFGVTGE